MDGIVTVHEARLVVKSFSQVQGVDYDEIFSSVAMLKVRRIHVSIICIYEIWQMDVKTSFLTSFREERLYVIQSESFFLSILRMLKGMLAPAFLLRTGVSISELECML